MNCQKILLRYEDICLEIKRVYEIGRTYFIDKVKRQFDIIKEGSFCEKYKYMYDVRGGIKKF